MIIPLYFDLYVFKLMPVIYTYRLHHLRVQNTLFSFYNVHKWSELELAALTTTTIATSTTTITSSSPSHVTRLPSQAAVRPRVRASIMGITTTVRTRCHLTTIARLIPRSMIAAAQTDDE